MYVMLVDVFLCVMMCDVVWGFFYGWVNFDYVFGMCNYYGKVDMYVGIFNGILKDVGVDYIEIFDMLMIMVIFKVMLYDWINEGFDLFVVFEEMGMVFGCKYGDNGVVIECMWIVMCCMLGFEGDLLLCDDLLVNCVFFDVVQDELEVYVELGFEGELYVFNLFKYLLCLDVMWNLLVMLVCGCSLFCLIIEEFILLVFYGNDCVEWFL